jgi:hypothetical protein
MSDEPEYEDCDEEECSCGGKPPYALGFSINPAGIDAAVYICDREHEGRQVMVMTSLNIPADEVPEEVQSAVGVIADHVNMMCKQSEAALIAQVDQAEAAIRDAETNIDPAS